MLNIPYINLKWINQIRNILNTCGISDLRLNQRNVTCKKHKKNPTQTLFNGSIFANMAY